MRLIKYSKPKGRPEDRPISIYCLWCPIAKKIRYIGKSNQPERRAYHHIFAADRKYYDHHASRWLRKLKRLGLEPRMRVLAVLAPGSDWQHAERALIFKALCKGWPLTNGTLGGEGVSFITKEQEAAAKAARKAGVTEKVRSRMSEGVKSAWADPEKRARILAAQKLAAAKPERRAQLGQLRRTPEGELRRIAAVKAYWQARRATRET